MIFDNILSNQEKKFLEDHAGQWVRDTRRQTFFGRLFAFYFKRDGSVVDIAISTNFIHDEFINNFAGEGAGPQLGEGIKVFQLENNKRWCWVSPLSLDLIGPIEPIITIEEWLALRNDQRRRRTIMAVAAKLRLNKNNCEWPSVNEAIHELTEYSNSVNRGSYNVWANSLNSTAELCKREVYVRELIRLFNMNSSRTNDELYHS